MQQCAPKKPGGIQPKKYSVAQINHDIKMLTANICANVTAIIGISIVHLSISEENTKTTFTNGRFV